MLGGRRAMFELRQRERHARELLVDLFEVIRIEVTVAAGPDELAHFEVALLREHVREQRIGGDVERHAEENVGAALVELATQPLVRHVELEERVTGHAASSGRARPRSRR